MSVATTLIWLGGMLLVFLGERVIGEGIGRFGTSGLGLVLVVASLGLRGLALSRETEPGRRKASLQALIFAAVATSSLLVYALMLQTVTDTLGLTEEARQRWTGSFGAILSVLLVLGAVPMAALDLLLGQHPMSLPRTGTARAVGSGLVTALAIALVFPINFLAVNNEAEYNAAYFKVAEPGGSTLALVRTLTEPVKAYLFYPSGNETKEALLPFFRKLEGESAGMLEVEALDQALSGSLAEEFGVRENGYVVLQVGEKNEKLRISQEIDSAKNDLKKLDSKVQQSLLAVTRGTRVVYMLTGHGEGTPKQRENQLRKTSRFKRMLQGLEYQVKDFGQLDGSTEAVPDDAAVVFVMSPLESLLTEEVDALKAYADRGGSFFVTVSEDGDKLEGLLSYLGLKAEPELLAQEKPQLRGQSPFVIVTDRFGTHASVHTIGRVQRGFVVVPGAIGIDEVKDHPGKRTALIRSPSDVFGDANKNARLDDGETKKVYTLAWAANGEGDTPYKAIVVGDVEMFSDFAFELQWGGNFLFARDALHWLTGDEDLVGEITDEQDVKIVHTRAENAFWFYLTVAGVPLLVVLLGTLLSLIRRRVR